VLVLLMSHPIGENHVMI